MSEAQRKAEIVTQNSICPQQEKLDKLTHYWPSHFRLDNFTLKSLRTLPELGQAATCTCFPLVSLP